MRKTAVAAGGAALAIALAGCGSGTSGETSGDPSGDPSGNVALFGSAQALVQAASAETAQAKTVKFTMEMSVGGKQRTAHGKMRFAGDSTDMAMTFEKKGGTTQLRYINEVVYLQAPDKMATMLPSGKTWLKIDLNSEGIIAQLIGPIIKKAVNNADPVKLMQRIKHAGTVIRKERTATGSHYWIKIDMIEAIKQGYPDLPQSILEKGQEKFAGVTIPMQVWLNNDTLPTKIKMNLEKLVQAMSVSTSTASGGTVVVNYSDWGAPVEIKAPPESKVTTPDLPDLGDLPSLPNMPN